MISGTSKAATEGTLSPLNKISLYALSFGMATFPRTLSLTFWDLYMAGNIAICNSSFYSLLQHHEGHVGVFCLLVWGGCLVFFLHNIL